MTEYLFILGRTPELAGAEILSLFPKAKRVIDSVWQVRGDIDAGMCMKRLGGTVKIARLIRQEESVPDAGLISRLLTDVSGSSRSITFGISTYPANNSIRHEAEIKRLLESEGYHARYVIPSHGKSDLSSVVVSKQHVTEFVVVRSDDAVYIGHTIAVQEFETWGEHDFGRPEADPKKGMLPPKVARMAVNIALGERATGAYVVDPFCGVGTILAEALLMGTRVAGFDVSPDAVAMSRKNLAWLSERTAQFSTSNIVQLDCWDATHISEKLAEKSVDAIVTEPFLGSTKLGEGTLSNTKKISNIIKGLEKLYIGCLREWATVLQAGGRVVIAFPSIRIKNKTYDVKRVIDRCEMLGYTRLAGPIEYGRPQAIVKREFYIFKKK